MFLAILIFLSIALLSLDNVSATVSTANTTNSNITNNSNSTASLMVTTSTADKTAPTIKSVDPSNKAVNVSINKIIKVTFSEAIKAGNNWIELKDSSGKAVSFTKSINGSVLTVTPTSSLAKGTRYTLTLHTGSLTDLSGNKIALCGSTFTTDGTAPIIKSVDPANKATNVAINKTIKVTFSESIKNGTGWIELKDSAGNAVSFTQSIIGSILTVIPTSNLTSGTTYTLTLHTGSLTDLSGNKIALCGSTFTTSTMFTIAQIQNASASLKSYIESNNKLPNYVTIGSSQVTMPQFLQLLVTSLLQINSGTSTAISIGNVGSPTNSTGDSIYGNINKTEYLKIAQSIKSFIDSNGIAPNYATSSLGKIQYETLIYMFSKVVNYYGTNKALPNYVSVDSTVANPGSSSIPSELQQYLQATTNCQVTNSQIQALAKSITSGKTSTYDKAAAIFNWVRDNIGYSFYYNTKYGAVGTLNAKTGNCVDTAHLLIALERAAGIPARYEHVYAKFSSGNWYGHVIAQVWINGKWYNADATSSSNTFGVINSWNTATATVYGTYATLPF